MIYGVGTDVVEVSRIAKALERFGDNFAKKILNHEAVSYTHLTLPTSDLV